MTAYLLTWNPSHDSWNEVFADAYQLIQEGYCPESDRGWSCHMNWKNIKEGDSVWFLRQGVDPKGLFGHGEVVGSPYPDIRAFDGKPGHFVRYCLDWLVNPESEPDQMFSRSLLKSDPLLSSMHWDPQGSGIRIPEAIEAALLDYF